MKAKPLYIFDLDGTLASIDHRRHLVESSPKKWREFYAACAADVPSQPVVRTAAALFYAGADVWVWSGRSDEVRVLTEDWLVEAMPWLFGDLNDGPVLRMRKANDFQADTKLKRSWLLSMDPADRARLVAVFDDRLSVVTMWREEGVTCFQVAPGDF